MSNQREEKPLLEVGTKLQRSTVRSSVASDIEEEQNLGSTK